MVQNLFHLIGCDAAKLFSASPIYKLLPIAAVAVAFFAPQVISFILLLVVYLLGYGLITYDEAYHTQNYYAFLPIRRSEYIIGKYAFTFVMTMIGILLCFVSSSLGSLILTDPGLSLIHICQVTLYQAFPKGDKMDFIIQKAVELGVSRVVPVLTRRCVARPDPKAMTGKLTRFSRIALEAAKQSGRGRIPQIGELVGFDSAVKMAASDPLSLFFYEGGGRPLSQLLSPQVKSLSLFVGSEGGFDPEEVELAAKAGLIPVTLGPRILRCETCLLYTSRCV